MRSHRRDPGPDEPRTPSRPPPGRFVSALAARLDKQGGVEISTAGHPAPIAVGHDGARPVQIEANLPLAVEPRSRFENGGELSPAKGDRLLLYTDGAFEVTASGDPSDQLGIERLAGIAREARDGDQADFLQRVLAGIERFAGGRFADDVALLDVMRAG